MIEHAVAMSADERFEIAVAGPHVDRDKLIALREVLAQHPGATPVQLQIDVPEIGHVVIAIAARYAVQPNPALRRQVATLFGRAALAPAYPV